MKKILACSLALTVLGLLSPACKPPFSNPPFPTVGPTVTPTATP